MANVAVIGTQWGDEGKGKVVDLYAEDAGVIARFQGETTQAIPWLSRGNKLSSTWSRRGFYMTTRYA